MYDTYEIITAILATPAAILGVMDITGRVRVILDDSHKLKMLRKNPIGDDIEQRFYVKSTHAKYIMGEGSSELTKLRVIRALKNVNKLRIDLERDEAGLNRSGIERSRYRGGSGEVV